MRQQPAPPPTVGIPLAKLRAHAPRGVVRVARAIAEELVGDSSLHLLAISDPFFERNDILVESWEMQPWLAGHSLKIAGPLAGGRISESAQQTAINLLKRTVTRAGLKEPARRALTAARRCANGWRRSTLPWPAATRPGANELAACQPQYRSLRQFDAILSFECYDGIWEWPVELFDCRLIGVFHDAIPLRVNEGKHWDPAGYYKATGRMVSRADAIACDSLSSERDLHAFFCNSRGKTRVIPLGHDRERFLPQDRGDRPASCGSPASRKSSGKRIAMIGEIEPRKNQAGMLRACQRLAADHPQEKLTLLLIGKQAPSNQYESLERQARKFVNIEHLGYVADDQIGDVLRSCDVFVYPSLWEGFGIPVLEAMSAGVPVVCSKNSSLTEVGGELAYYCDPYDPASIAEAVRRALGMSPERRERWVHEARRRASAFSWRAAATQFSEMLHELLRAPRATGPHGTNSFVARASNRISESRQIK